ncbi:hypothetical protein NBRC116590_10590 [Pelagimonas sp. KU-00592-HH]|uniref:hypothetical protein n=1 Tax=Pelagimonas sp. KU-00592-HH TaxID=3127651 RepID=UPI003107E9DB
MMIPASKARGVPGADDPSIMAEIVDDANKYAARDVHRALSAWSILSNADKGARVSAFLRDSAGDAAVLQAVVNRVYYRNDTVMGSLGIEARAPIPKGF